MDEQQGDFFNLLDLAIEQIAFVEGKTKGKVRAELGQSVNKSENYIGYLQKNNKPKTQKDLENLACEISRRRGFPDRESLLGFLTKGGHSDPVRFYEEVISMTQGAKQHTEEQLEHSVEGPAKYSWQRITAMLVLAGILVSIAVNIGLAIVAKGKASPAAVVFCPGDESMVFVGAGSFLMGSSREDIELFAVSCPPKSEDENCGPSYFEDELPKRSVWLPSFCIDRYEVTNSQFSQFVEATVVSEGTAGKLSGEWSDPQGVFVYITSG
jgi:hypothetical protein